MRPSRAPSWAQESSWTPRLALTTSEDLVRGSFLQSGLRAVRALGDESLVEHCAGACGQSTFFEFFNYPASVLVRMLSTAVPSLARRHGDVEHALWLLGNCVGMDFLQSEAGRVMSMLMRGEARRLMNHLPAAYLMSLTGTRTVQWLGAQHCRLVMARDFLPPSFHEGLLVSLLDGMNTQRPHVEGFQTGLLASEYDISWR